MLKRRRLSQNSFLGPPGGSMQLLFNSCTQAQGMIQRWPLNVKPYCADNSSLTKKYGWRRTGTSSFVSGNPVMIISATSWWSVIFSCFHLNLFQLRLWYRKKVDCLNEFSFFLSSAKYLLVPDSYLRSKPYCWSRNKCLWRGWGKRFLAMETRGLWSVQRVSRRAKVMRWSCSRPKPGLEVLPRISVLLA